MRSATVTRPGPNKGLQVAVKCIDRTNLPREDEEDLLEEVSDIRSIIVGGGGGAQEEMQGVGKVERSTGGTAAAAAVCMLCSRLVQSNPFNTCQLPVGLLAFLSSTTSRHAVQQ